MFVSFFLHNTVVTVHLLVLVFASQLFQNFLGRGDCLAEYIFCFVDQYPSQVDENAVLHLNTW